MGATSPHNAGAHENVAFLNVRTAEVLPDRRIARRFVVDCPARLTLAGGLRDGRLTDLSEHGARFEGLDPPPAGISGYLAWAGEEHYCTVIWSKDGRSGLRFERAIGTGLIERSATSWDLVVKPVAAVAKIPLGQRRSSRVAADD